MREIFYDRNFFLPHITKLRKWAGGPILNTTDKVVGLELQLQFEVQDWATNKISTKEKENESRIVWGKANPVQLYVLLGLN